MSINISIMKLSTQNIIIHVPSELIPEFQKLINRGANCWPDATPAIKEFIDLATNGEVMQDYYSQGNKTRPD